MDNLKNPWILIVLSWIIFLLYIVISYTIGISGLSVFKQCKDPREDSENLKGESVSISSIVFTTFSLITCLFCLYISGYKRSINECVQFCLGKYNSNDVKSLIPVGITILFMISTIISVILTAVTEFYAYNNMHNCSMLSSTTTN